MDVVKTKEPIGYLDPIRICQTQHTVTLIITEVRAAQGQGA